MGLIFALNKRDIETTEAEQNARANRDSNEDEAPSLTCWQHIVAKVVERYVTLPRVVQLFSLYFGLIILAGIGGVIFNMCEYSKEETLLAERNQIWGTINGTFFKPYANSTHGNITFNATEIAIAKQWGEDSKLYMDNNMWQLRYAAFFAATTFTTTGFGLQAPVTKGGRIMVFLYGLPAIMMYGTIARKIGLLAIHYMKKGSLLVIDQRKWNEKRLYIIGAAVGMGFMSLAGIIEYTATDEGFGNGIDGYHDALYFLFTTTTTIGYGDVMMSGSNPFLTVLIGIWLATTCGLIIVYSTELGSATKIDTTKLRESRISANSRNHILKVVKEQQRQQDESD